MARSEKKVIQITNLNPNSMTSSEISGNNRKEAIELLNKLKKLEKLKTMELKKEFEPIRKWAKEKGILVKGDVKTQYVKLQEEAGELAEAILKENNKEIVDAIGDCVVVLTSIASLSGYDIEYCINTAYNVINKRKGKMINGTFVKKN